MTEPAKLTDEDLEAVLADQGGLDPENADFTELVEGAGRWLKDRMENDPESLPPTFMVKLYLDGQKAIAAKQIPDTAPEGSVSILDRVDALPREHAIAVVKGELARLDSLRADHFAKLEQLEGD